MLSDTELLQILWKALRASGYYLAVHCVTGRLIVQGLPEIDSDGDAVMGETVFMSTSTDMTEAIDEFVAWQVKNRLSGETNG